MIDTELKEITSNVVKAAEEGKVSQREIAQVLDAWAQLTDYYSEIQERCFEGGMFLDGVIVKVDGATVKFDNVEALAEWMSHDLD